MGEGEEGRFVGHCGCLRGVGRGVKSCSRFHTLLLESWLLPSGLANSVGCAVVGADGS